MTVGIDAVGISNPVPIYRQIEPGLMRERHLSASSPQKHSCALIQLRLLPTLSTISKSASDPAPIILGVPFGPVTAKQMGQTVLGYELYIGKALSLGLTISRVEILKKDGLFSEGLPFTFASYDLLGSITLKDAIAGIPWFPSAPPQTRTQEMPLLDQIVKLS